MVISNAVLKLWRILLLLYGCTSEFMKHLEIKRGEHHRINTHQPPTPTHPSSLAKSKIGTSVPRLAILATPTQLKPFPYGSYPFSWLPAYRDALQPLLEIYRDSKMYFIGVVGRSICVRGVRNTYTHTHILAKYEQRFKLDISPTHTGRHRLLGALPESLRSDE